MKLPATLRSYPGISVAPLVGAWIEIVVYCVKAITKTVAPLVGAWIEIGLGVSFEQS